MAGFRIGPFLGANTKDEPMMLEANVGVLSLNHRPDKGGLRPWKVPLTVKTVAAGIKTMHILPRSTVSDTIYWLVWSTRVHVVLSFKASNPTKRFYFTGSGAPKSSDNVIGLAGEPFPTSYRDLGVPKPVTAPTVTETVAGTGSDENRYYAYTYLTDWDEEGPPAISAIVTCKPNAQFDITTLAAPPTGAGENRGINRIRLYRTKTGDLGAKFYFLKDVVLPATSTTDNALATGQDTMPSALYAMPPSDLKCLTPLWNGIMAGISGNSIRFCELNKPHAWPAKYEILCHETPIGLAVFDRTLVVLTTGKPLIVTGDLPEAMRDTPVEFIAPCLSEPSIVALSHGECWATSDGIAYIGRNGPPRFLTANHMLPEAWQALAPGTMQGGQYQGRYFAFYDLGGGLLKGLMVDPLSAEATGVYGLSQGYTAVHYDRLSAQMYVLSGTDIQQWNAGASNMTVSFESKTFRQTRPLNMAVAEVIASTYPATFTLYADARAAWIKTVNGRNPFLLPSGYLADDYRIKIDTAYDVTGVVVAETLGEIAST
jgi:hypothetical protein